MLKLLNGLRELMDSGKIVTMRYRGEPETRRVKFVALNSNLARGFIRAIQIEGEEELWRTFRTNEIQILNAE